MTVQPLTKATFRDAVKDDALTLVDFSAAWCPPCKVLMPILEQLSEETRDARIYKVDTDAEPELASAFGIMSMPTVIAFRAGEPVEKLVGLRPKSAYEAIIRKYASSAAS